MKIESIETFFENLRLIKNNWAEKLANDKKKINWWEAKKTMSDDDFDGVTDQEVTVTTTDNDTAGFTVIESGGSTNVGEDGSSDTFTVVLNSEPTSDVVLAISSNDTDESTVSTGSITFTSGNWDTPQTVSVTGADDNFADGSQASIVSVSVVIDFTQCPKNSGCIKSISSPKY